MDAVIHMATLRITACAAEPREALEVMCDGSFNVLEAAQAAGVKKVVAASSASVYGLADTFPTRRRPPPLQQPHLVRREQGHARRAAALLQRHVRPALRRAALLQRLRPAHGHPRQVHRGADPLDGAHRGRPAAADLRRRQQTMDFVYVDDVARANILALQSDVSDEVFNVASGTETSLIDSPRRCCA